MPKADSFSPNISGSGRILRLSHPCAGRNWISHRRRAWRFPALPATAVSWSMPSPQKNFLPYVTTYLFMLCDLMSCIYIMHTKTWIALYVTIIYNFTPHCRDVHQSNKLIWTTFSFIHKWYRPWYGISLHPQVVHKLMPPNTPNPIHRRKVFPFSPLMTEHHHRTDIVSFWQPSCTPPACQDLCSDLFPHQLLAWMYAYHQHMLSGCWARRQQRGFPPSVLGSTVGSCGTVSENIFQDANMPVLNLEEHEHSHTTDICFKILLQDQGWPDYCDGVAFDKVKITSSECEYLPFSTLSAGDTCR